MNQEDILRWIQNGENSGMEFKRDDIRPEQLAKEIVALLNFKGGKILLGVEDDGTLSGITRAALEEWVMNVCSDIVHPRIIPYYEEIQMGEKRIAVISVDMGISKPYVMRHGQGENIYIRVGLTSRLASREEQMRLFQEGGFLHVEILPVPGTCFAHLDPRRLRDYFGRVRKLENLPREDEEWVRLLINMEYMTVHEGSDPLCTIAGLLLFGHRPGRFLRQAGLEWVVFPGTEKDYDTRDRASLDGPLVALWDEHGEQTEQGLLELLMSKVRQHASREKLAENQLTRMIEWDFAPEAVREAVINAFVHRDWTRPADVEISLYSDRMEVISPGPLPNHVTVERMKLGLRIPRNPILIQTLKDYGYVEHMGMGVRNKIIAGMRRHNGTEPEFVADAFQVLVCLFK
ncbi:RNA-binding domain-containing protein [Desulfonema magnum]|uniref:ATP-dependent DNA helicase RecG C-terminal domain-containing protein n=1 Tax=Desulfonema magnum TaxID=45655 RepID=A0A975BUY0_9BACT|nr:RNA-binding domain-containing protein [Desulfonema magnum]QTA91967.1 ATP-dependent DNA helicase RecG C-terminal domain-containing protein [Desulfonema magnum]